MLFLITFRWQDGENQYYTRRFSSSENLDEAEHKAADYLSDMWGDRTVNQDGDYMPPEGYPAVRVDSITGCSTLEDAVKAIGFIDNEM
jgi:hypothetical protein